MTANMLKLNDTKTELFIAISPRNKWKLPDGIKFKIGTEWLYPSTTVRKLGVVFDTHLTMSSYITDLCKSLNYHLRNISRIRQNLDKDSCHHVIRSLILSRLEYANAMLLGTNAKNIARLQKLQNWAAKIILCAKKRDHATPLLKELHWLTVRNRITYKIMVTIYKSLNGLSPSYLSSTISLHVPKRTGLRSASDITRLTERRILPRNLASAANAMLHHVSGILYLKPSAHPGPYKLLRKVSKRTSSSINAYILCSCLLCVYSFCCSILYNYFVITPAVIFM